MKGLKKALLFGLFLLIGLIILSLWYGITFSMDVVSTYEVNEPSLEKKLLIATQGGDFKNAITSAVIERYNLDAVYIRAVDVTTLDTIDPKPFTAILVIHTWEYWKPPKTVSAFRERAKEYNNKMVYLATSGDGNYKIDGVDALSGESILANAPLFVDNINHKLSTILGINHPPISN